MSELKTLKDFESHIEESIHNRLCKDLRQEAIRYVKEIRRKTGTTGEIDYRLSFKHFFNITEEDLKEDAKRDKSDE